MNWKRLFSGVAMLLTIAVVAKAVPDIKRYIRISTM
jgi:hypothetical protein